MISSQQLLSQSKALQSHIASLSDREGISLKGTAAIAIYLATDICENAYRYIQQELGCTRKQAIFLYSKAVTKANAGEFHNVIQVLDEYLLLFKQFRAEQ